MLGADSQALSGMQRRLCFRWERAGREAASPCPACLWQELWQPAGWSGGAGSRGVGEQEPVCAARGSEASLPRPGWGHSWNIALSRPALQHYADDRHGHGGPPERHGRDSRDGWGGYGSDKRLSEGRGPPPPPR